MRSANDAVKREITELELYLLQQKWTKRVDTKRRATIKILELNSSAEEKVCAIGYQTALVNSAERLGEFLCLAEYIKEPEVFWRSFCASWNSCDKTWLLRGRLLRELRVWKARYSSIHPSEYLVGSDADFFRSLPNLVHVYRGASEQRIEGLAWTTDRHVALGFTRGHRGIPVPAPVIASAYIHKDHIFIATDTRQEREVVVDFERLTKVQFKPRT